MLLSEIIEDSQYKLNEVISDVLEEQIGKLHGQKIEQLIAEKEE